MQTATATQEHWNYATWRAERCIAADLDTMGDWLAAQVSGERCSVERAERAAYLTAYEDMPNDQLFALTFFSEDKGHRMQASYVLGQRYIAYRDADVKLKANEYLAAECEA